MMISNSFSIDDIHNIRNENYEKTKHLSHSELIESTNTRAESMKKRLEEIKNKKVNETIKI